MRNVVVSAVLFMCISGSATAMDFRQGHPYMHLAGWDQTALDQQTQGAVYLRARITKLEQENEELRNTISQIRESAKNVGSAAYDPRIQALIEENKRLSSLLVRGGTQGRATTGVDSRIQALVEENKRLSSLLVHNSSQGGMSADVYTQKLYVLEAEKEKIQEALNKVVSQSDLRYAKDFTGYKQENARLKEALAGVSGHQENRQAELLNLEETIKVLKNKNQKLLVKQVKAAPDMQVAFKTQNTKILSLQDDLEELRGDNIKLEQALTEASTKTQMYIKRVGLVRNEKVVSSKFVATLEAKLARIKIENDVLKLEAQVKQAVAAEPASGRDDGFLSLKSQNKSLRETIRAQNEVLVSADNATQTGERLLTENAILQRKLEKVSDSNASTGESAQKLFSQNKILKNEILRRDVYIKKLSGLKVIVKKLRQKNDEYALRQEFGSNVEEQIESMQDENQSLKSALDEEREHTLVYRTKIRKYQVELSNAKHGQSESSDQQEILTTLRLENHELKARIKLLSELSQLAVISQKEGKDQIVARAPERRNIDAGVTFIDAPYPPVDNVSPLLDREGSQIPYDDVGGGASSILPEDILEQKLKPLSELK